MGNLGQQERGRTRAILTAISPRTRAIALVGLIVEVSFLPGIYAIPDEQRLIAFAIWAFLLLAVLLACVAIEWKGRVDKKNLTSELKVPSELRGSIIVIDERVSSAKGRLSEVYRTASNFKFSGRYEDAIEHYKTILKETPDHWKSKYNIGSCLLYARRIDEAESHFIRLAEDLTGVKNSDTAEVAEMHHGCYIQLNQICDLKENYADGIKYLSQSLSIKPDDALSYLNLTIAAIKLGEIEEATKWYSVLLKHPEKLEVLASMNESDTELISSISNRKEP